MKRIVIAVVVAVVVLGAVYMGLRSLGRRAAQSILSQLQTAQVERGPLVARVETAGTLESPSSIDLAFRASGQVTSVDAEEGQQVSAGQQIACLDAVDAQLQVEQAEAGVAIAQARLEQIKKPASAAEIAAARSSLASAQEALKKLQTGPAARDLEIARLQWEQAKDQLWSAQAQRDATVGNKLSPDYAKDQAQAAVASAEVAVQIARLRYEQAQEGADAAELRAAAAQVAQAEASLKRLVDGASPEDVRVAEAQVIQAEVTLRQAKRQLEQMCLRAPFDGTVTRLDLRVGQIVGPTTLAGELVSAGGAGSSLRLVADLSEVDVAKVSVGQEAEITLDALPGRLLKGHVSAVTATGRNVQGVVNYPVIVAIDEADAAIRAGMTASASIVVERRENALLVPNRAIRARSGQYYVQVLRQGEPRPLEVLVQIGLSGDGHTEVLGDTLKEGDTLLVNASANMFRQMQGGPQGGVVFEAQ